MDALEYLHNQCQPPLIHGDLKPSNILLTEDMSGHVGDLGISKILSDDTSKTLLNSVSFTGLRGSIGYIAPGNELVLMLLPSVSNFHSATYTILCMCTESTDDIK